MVRYSVGLLVLFTCIPLSMNHSQNENFSSLPQPGACFAYQLANGVGCNPLNHNQNTNGWHHTRAHFHANTHTHTDIHTYTARIEERIPCNIIMNLCEVASKASLHHSTNPTHSSHLVPLHIHHPKFVILHRICCRCVCVLCV